MNCRPFAVVTLASVSLVPAGQVVGSGATSMPTAATATILPGITNHTSQPSERQSSVTKNIAPDGSVTSAYPVDARKIVIVDLP